MSAVSPDACLAIASRAVELALSRGASQAEAYVDEDRNISAEIDGGRLRGAQATQSHGIGIRVVAGGRLGFGSASGLDAAAAVDHAIHSARGAPVKGFSLPSGGRARGRADAWDDGVASLRVEDVVGRAKVMLDAWSLGSFSGGEVSMDIGARAIANSEGVQAADRATSLAASASFVEGAASTWAADISHRDDLADVVTSAEGRLRRLADPVDPPWKGAMDIVFRPEAAAELLSGFVVGAMTGDDAKRGVSVWSESQGKEVAHGGMSVVDDPVRSGIGGCLFDDEGLSTAARPLIDAGVVGAFLFDAWDAHTHGTKPTASAVRGGFSSTPTTGAHHVWWDIDGPSGVDALVAGVDKGYFVDSILGAHTVNPTTGEFSVTAPNVWTIRGGEVQGACREIALSGSVPRLLKELKGGGPAVRMEGCHVPHLLGTLDVSI